MRARSVTIATPVVASHRQTCAAESPETAKRPHGETASAEMGAVCIAWKRCECCALEYTTPVRPSPYTSPPCWLYPSTLRARATPCANASVGATASGAAAPPASGGADGSSAPAASSHGSSGGSPRAAGGAGASSGAGLTNASVSAGSAASDVATPAGAASAARGSSRRLAARRGAGARGRGGRRAAQTRFHWKTARSPPPVEST